MKFIKIPTQNKKDFFLINLNQITYIAVNQKSNTCKLFFNGAASITLFPHQVHALLTQISEYNRQIVTHWTKDLIEEDF